MRDQEYRRRLSTGDACLQSNQRMVTAKLGSVLVIFALKLVRRLQVGPQLVCSHITGKT